MKEMSGADTHVDEPMGSMFRLMARFFLMLMVGTMALVSAGLLMMQLAHG